MAENEQKTQTKSTILVIGSGLPRTGSLSLQVALETLGFGPCHHFTTIMGESFPYSESRLWRHACNTEERERRQQILHTIFSVGGYRSAVDWPTCAFVDDLVQMYPDAKFIHGVRSSAEDWRKSFDDTVGRTQIPMVYYSSFALPWQRFSLQPLLSCLKNVTRRLHGVDTFEPSGGLEIYHRHNEHVLQLVPNDRLLEHHPGDGWEPLCAFLDVPVPTDGNGKPLTYPHINDTEEFRKGMRMTVFAGCAWWATLMVAACFLAKHAIGPRLGFVRTLQR